MTKKVRSSYRLSLLLSGLIFFSLLTIAVLSLQKIGGLFAVSAIPMEWTERLGSSKMELEITKQVEASVGLKLAAVMGRRPWEIDLDHLSRSIQGLGWIREVRIQRVLPDRLVVAIAPLRPLAVIVIGPSRGKMASLRPLTTDGRLMPEWSSETVPDVPFLRGERFVSDQTLRSAAVHLIEALPDKGVLARSNLAEIGWSDGLTLLLLSPRTEIQLGPSLSSTEIQKKLIRVSRVLDYLSVRQMKAPVLDATSVKKVVVRAQHRP